MSQYTSDIKLELEEIQTKIKRLNRFISGDNGFKSLSSDEQIIIIKQLGFMESYALMLDDRLHCD